MKLKKCERCGRVPELHESTGLVLYWYKCKCGRTVEHSSVYKVDAVTVWNAHTKTPPTRGELEAEVERLKAEVAELEFYRSYMAQSYLDVTNANDCTGWDTTATKHAEDFASGYDEKADVYAKVKFKSETKGKPK
jgi:hypothetical protein